MNDAEYKATLECLDGVQDRVKRMKQITATLKESDEPQNSFSLRKTSMKEINKEMDSIVTQLRELGKHLDKESAN